MAPGLARRGDGAAQRSTSGGPQLIAAAQRLARIATRRGLRVASAESCTGGLLAKSITDLPGASAHYAGGVVAYANDVKVAQLGVDPASLEAHGAVSREVAVQMACGARSRFAADVAMAVTGIAGPKGGTPGKPVGTVWLAVAMADGQDRARKACFPGDREAVRDASVAVVLQMAAEAAGGATYGPGDGD